MLLYIQKNNNYKEKRNYSKTNESSDILIDEENDKDIEEKDEKLDESNSSILNEYDIAMKRNYNLKNKMKSNLNMGMDIGNNLTNKISNNISNTTFLRSESESKFPKRKDKNLSLKSTGLRIHLHKDVEGRIYKYSKHHFLGKISMEFRE